LHMNVHENDVRLQLPGRFNGLLTVGALRNHADPWYLVQHPTPGFPYMKMIVDDN